SAFNERTMFLFYATPLIPFMVLAIVLVFGYLIGPAPEPVRGAHALTADSGHTRPDAAAPGEHGRDAAGAEPHPAAGARRLVGAAAAGAFVLVVLANFAYFHPILSAQTIPYDSWHDRIWLDSWV